MTVEQKHKLSQKIVSSLSKIRYYEEIISKIKKDTRLFYEASLTCRLIGIRSTVWVDLTPDEVVLILRRKIKQEKITLKENEDKIK